MSDAKRFTEEGEIWVCGACGKAWRGDSYAAPDVSCFLNRQLCREASLHWLGKQSRCDKADSVDYDWTVADWQANKVASERRGSPEGESA